MSKQIISKMNAQISKTAPMNATTIIRKCVESLEGYRNNEKKDPNNEGAGQMCDAEKAAREYLKRIDSLFGPNSNPPLGGG